MSISRVAVRPPEYFPRLAYCALFFAADRFVVADTFPYSRQSYQNRTRVRTPRHGDRAWQWLSVPLGAGALGRPIHAVQIDAGTDWARRHRKALQFNYGSAPFFEHYAPEVDDLLARPWPSLGDLTAATVMWAHRKLGAPSGLTLASSLPGSPATVPDVLRAARAQSLVTLGESAQRDAAHAEAAGLALGVLPFEEVPRRQNFEGFEPGMSVLDLLFNHGPKAAVVLRTGLESGYGSAAPTNRSSAPIDGPSA